MAEKLMCPKCGSDFLQRTWHKGRGLLECHCNTCGAKFDMQPLDAQREQPQDAAAPQSDGPQDIYEFARDFVASLPRMGAAPEGAASPEINAFIAANGGHAYGALVVALARMRAQQAALDTLMQADTLQPDAAQIRADPRWCIECAQCHVPGKHDVACLACASLHGRVDVPPQLDAAQDAVDPPGLMHLTARDVEALDLGRLVLEMQCGTTLWHGISGWWYAGARIEDTNGGKTPEVALRAAMGAAHE